MGHLQMLYRHQRELMMLQRLNRRNPLMQFRNHVDTHPWCTLSMATATVSGTPSTAGSRGLSTSHRMALSLRSLSLPCEALQQALTESHARLSNENEPPQNVITSFRRTCGILSIHILPSAVW